MRSHDYKLLLMGASLGALALLVAAVVLGIFPPSQAEAPPRPAPAAAQAPPLAPKPTTTPADPPAAAAPAEPVEEAAPPAKPNPQIPAERAEENAALIPLPLELPAPFFGGTPWDGFLPPNFEEETFKKREPFLAPPGTTNLAAGIVPTSSSEPRLGSLAQITDGNKDVAEVVEFDKGIQWIQLDLGQESEIYALLFWHFFQGKRFYNDTVIHLSDDPAFETGVTTLYNNDYDNSAGLGVGNDPTYFENHQGRLVDTGGVTGRYVRFYSYGNTANEFNHYIEVEVWGRAAGLEPIKIDIPKPFFGGAPVGG
jgi:hypothetical protein